jgi:hypothetical protein
MELHCPQCGSRDLKKVSLAHQEGYSKHQDRLCAGCLIGSGPDLVLGRHPRTVISRPVEAAEPSSKSGPLWWLSALLAFLCVGWLIFYVNQ